MSAPAIPEALSKLVHQRGISSRAWFDRGRLDLHIDGRARVKCLPGRRAHEVVLETKLIALPEDAVECEALLARVMLYVTANAGQQVGVIVISPEGRRLLLQALLDGGDLDGFEIALEHFLNEIDRWLAIVGNFHA